MNHDNTQKGFTLVELLLAMAFISVLLLAIAMTILQIGAVYNRGMIVKEVNQIGRTVSTELQSAIIKTAPFSISQTTGSHYFVQGTPPNAWGGRLCVGQYSYIWNYGSVLQVNTSPTRNRYTGEAALISANSTPIRLVKVYDTRAAYCNDLTLPIDPTNATELLNVGDHNLAVHDFYIGTSTSADDPKTAQRLYNITFTIGTNETNPLLKDASNVVIGCKGPGTTGADLSYCVVQKFSIAVRAGNMVQ
jgi:prepilin-type N-terminal cleavage/methylation domain-containing protein